MQKKSNKKSFPKGKQNKRNFKREDDKLREEDGKGLSKHSYNDVNWYSPDQQILLDSARIPFSFPVGYPFKREGTIQQANLVLSNYDDSIPGICAIGVTPTIGNAREPNDPVNVAANGMYTFVRHLNSGSRNYDANDLMLYCMAVDSVYTMLSFGTRVYATLSMYAQGNKYLNDALLRAQHIDPADFRANMASFRTQLNIAINKVAALAVPAVLPIFQRHSWMFSNYYIEGESIKDQIYLYKLLTYYIFDYDSSGAGMLKAYYLPAASSNNNMMLTVSDFMSVINSMIDPIYADEDFNIISGDILKAYGGNILKLGVVPDMLTLQLQYDENVLLQMKNAKCKEVLDNTIQATPIYDGKYINDFFDITQTAGLNSYLKVNTNYNALSCVDYVGTPNAIILNVNDTTSASNVLQASLNEFTKPTLITSPHADVTPAEVMEITRGTMGLLAHYDSSQLGNTEIDKWFFGSEWYHCANYYAFHRDKSNGVVSMAHIHADRAPVLSDSVAGTIRRFVSSTLSIVSSFKYAPEISIVQVENGVVYEAGRSHFEVDNYALIDCEVVGRLHDTAVMGEYNVPKVALFATK